MSLNRDVNDIKLCKAILVQLNVFTATQQSTEMQTGFVVDTDHGSHLLVI